MEFIDIRELRAKYITEKVTLLFCDIESAFSGNQAKEVNDFSEGISCTQISCYRPENGSTIDSFHQVDELMRYQYTSGYVLIYPFQEIIEDPYDETELKAMVQIAEGWADETQAHIIFILDTSNTFQYYTKPLY